MGYTATSQTLKPSAHGWRLTFYDAKNEPVASFWATTKDEVRRQAAPYVANG